MELRRELRITIFLMLTLSSNFFLSGAEFAGEEYTQRLHRAQAAMKKQGFGAMLLTMPAHHMYFTGINTEFFTSPTRNYYLVLPAEGKITAVVPTVISNLYEPLRTVGRVVSWPAPRPEDEGISLLEGALILLTPRDGGRLKVGAELGHELSLRMPIIDFMHLSKRVARWADFEDVSDMLKQLRSVKSEAEVALHREVCQRQSTAIENIPKVLRAGMTEKDACRLARIELLKAGVDRIGYMSCRSGPGGYNDIVGGATNRKLQEGDVLIIDSGSVLDHYFCDFNRNWYVGNKVPADLKEVQDALYAAMDAGIAAARAGSNTADVWHAMGSKLPGSAGNVGRWGHSVGMVITEWPSIVPADALQNQTLADGMVFALEPGLGYGNNGQFLVHEEVIVVREGGGQILSKRGPRDIPLIPLGATDV